MIIDGQGLFSDDQAITANGASDNYIDLQVAGDIGPGNPIPIVIQLTAAAGGTTPTIKVAVQVDDNASFSTPKTVAESNTLSGGAAGDTLSIHFIPRGTDERYVRLYYTVGGTSPSYKITAGIVADHQTNKANV